MYTCKSIYSNVTTLAELRGTVHCCCNYELGVKIFFKKLKECREALVKVRKQGEDEKHLIGYPFTKHGEKEKTMKGILHHI